MMKWLNIEKHPPHCWETGNWDGKRSDFMFVLDKNGDAHVAQCYEGILDSSKFRDFYDRHDFEIENVTHICEIKDPQYQDLTFEKPEHNNEEQWQHVYQYQYYAWHPVKTSEGWVLFDYVTKIVDERPEVYHGMLPKITYVKIQK